MIPACEANGTERLSTDQFCGDFRLAPTFWAGKNGTAHDSTPSVVQFVGAHDEKRLFVVVFDPLALNIARPVTEVLLYPFENDGTKRAI